MNYTSAHKTALEKYRACSLQDMARCSGYPIEDGALIVNFLGQDYRVSYPDGEFLTVRDSEAEIPLHTQILVLHYLTSLTEASGTGRLISFKELPGGDMYIRPFTGRSIEPFVRIFGNHPQKLLDAAAVLGGQPNELGNIGVTITTFPRVPITFVLWEGDDEFPPSGNILFDASAPEILPTEDYAVLASMVVFALKRISESDKSESHFSQGTPEPIID